MIRPCFWGGTLRGTGWLAITIDASSQSGNKPKINNIYPQNFTRTVLCIPSGYSPTSWNVDSSHMTCAMAAHTHVGFARTVLLQYRTNKQKTCDRMIMRHIKNNSLFVLSWCEGFSRVSTALVFLLLSTDCDIWDTADLRWLSPIPVYAWSFDIEHSPDFLEEKKIGVFLRHFGSWNNAV